jgi:hypothetical protein
LKLVILEIGQGLTPRPIRNESAYQEAVAILDRLFNLDRAQTSAEQRYFRDLADMLYEYERANCVAEREPSAAVDA